MSTETLDLNEKLLSYDDVADFAGCSARHVFNERKRGRLVGFKIGESVRFSAADVRAWLGRCREGGAE